MILGTTIEIVYLYRICRRSKNAAVWLMLFQAVSILVVSLPPNCTVSHNFTIIISAVKLDSFLESENNSSVYRTDIMFLHSDIKHNFTRPRTWIIRQLHQRYQFGYKQRHKFGYYSQQCGPPRYLFRPNLRLLSLSLLRKWQQQFRGDS